MSNNPFRQQKDEGNENGFGSLVNANQGSNTTTTTHSSLRPDNSMLGGKSTGTLPNTFTGLLNNDYEQSGYTSAVNGVSDHHMQQYQDADSLLANDQSLYQSNGSQSQSFHNPFAVPLSNGAPLIPSTVAETSSLPEALTSSSHSSSTQRNSNYDESLPEAVQGLQLQHQSPEVVQQSRHAHVPSFSQVRKESIPNPRPTYVRALSSHIAESEAPRMTAGEAHAEVLRRLGKAEKTVKTLKRRGSNESLSSLISYSIRRPSISARPESGYSLDALAAVLEDVAQDGNLALVEAVMALGANPNFRSVNRLKNRRHDALNKATAAGHVDIIDFLLRQGATFNLGDSQKKDAFAPIDYKLLDVAYSGYGDVARYLISNQGANPFIEQWPREYHDANRTVYRRVVPVRVFQRTVLDAISRIGGVEQDMSLLKVIMTDPNFDPSAVSTRVYTDIPYSGDDTRMIQTTTHYSTLSSFVKAGWADAVEQMMIMNPDPSAYQKPDLATSEEGQIPSSNIQRYIYPANALTKDTWTYRHNDALQILHLLISHGFDMTTAQRTPDDSAPRTPLSRAILANAASAVQVLLQAHPELVKEDISFRLLLPGGEEREYVAQPLAAAIIQGSLETARMILRNGAYPSDPAFSYKNVLQFAAGHGGATATGILKDMIAMAPDMLTEAVESAIRKFKPDSVDVLLSCATGQKLDMARVWDLVLGCEVTDKDETIKMRYLRIIELVHDADVRGRPSQEAIEKAVEQDKVIAVEKLLSLRALESDEVMKWCEVKGKRGGWDEMLRKYPQGDGNGKW